MRVEERLAVTAAQQEDEASQVIAQLPGAVGAAADEASRPKPDSVTAPAEPDSPSLVTWPEGAVACLRPVAAPTASGRIARPGSRARVRP